MGDGIIREIQGFIRYMVSAVSSASLYSPGHRQVHRLSEDAFDCLRKALALEEEIVILFIEDELVCNNVPLDGSLYISKFMRIFALKGIEHLKFLRRLEKEELSDLVTALSRQGSQGTEVNSSANIKLGRLALEHSSDDRRDGEGDEESELLALDEIGFHEREAFREIRECIRSNRKFGMKRVNGIVRSFIHAFKQMSAPFMAFAALSSLDKYTFIHSTNVCILNLAQAMAMGIDGRLLHDVGVSGMLHDVGKLFIPREILSKPHALSDAEREIVREHPGRGAHYLLDLPGVPRLAVVCAYEHHMRFDGFGYPKALEGWQQNVCSQMTAVSDFFDALRTKRTYRDSMDFGTVAAMMLEGAGTQFHPVLTRNFLRILGGSHKAASASVGEETTPPTLSNPY